MAATASLSVTSAATEIALTPRALSSATAAIDFVSLRPTTAISAPASASPLRHAEADAAIAAGDDGHLAAEIEQTSGLHG